MRCCKRCVLVSAIMATLILPLINSCKSLNLFLIELILRYANIGFAGFSIQRFFNPWEKSWDGCFWYHSLSFVETWFSGLLEILKYSVKVIARLFHLDEADYCLGKIYKYCWSQQKSYPYLNNSSSVWYWSLISWL